MHRSQILKLDDAGKIKAVKEQHENRVEKKAVVI